MRVFKFGGTSLGSTKRINHVAEIVVSHAAKQQVVVVASAMAGITDNLVRITELHTSREIEARDEAVAAFFHHHRQVLEELLLEGVSLLNAKEQLEDMLRCFENCLHQMRPYLALWEYDFIISYGERLSSFLLSQALQAKGVNSRHVFGSDVVYASEDFGNAMALIPESKRKCLSVLQPLFERGVTPVITGFFGATRDGRIATFGRGGSDYSAAVLAALLEADSLTVWKEVDGVYTADPKHDKNARFINYLSYDTAAAMARAGAKVLHPETMEPVRLLNIPVWVRNTFKPEFEGTKIHN